MFNAKEHTVENWLLFDLYVRSLEDEPTLKINRFAESIERPHDQVSLAFSDLENSLQTLLIPRQLKRARGPGDKPVIVTTWADAHDGAGRRPFYRSPGLTPDGEAWSIYAGLTAGALAITQGLLLQRHWGSRLVHEQERKFKLRIVREKVDAFRNVANMSAAGRVVPSDQLRDLLNETSEMQGMRKRAAMMRNLRPTLGQEKDMECEDLEPYEASSE